VGCSYLLEHFSKILKRKVVVVPEWVLPSSRFYAPGRMMLKRLSNVCSRFALCSRQPTLLVFDKVNRWYVKLKAFSLHFGFSKST
jgi:hypothetical protein